MSNEYQEYYWVTRRALKQQFASLFINVVGGFGSSVFLGAYRLFLTEHPWLMAINPLLRALNGNVFSSLLARINSGLHLGTIKPVLRDRNVLANILVVLSTILMTSISMIIILSLVLGSDLLLMIEVIIPAKLIVVSLLFPFTTYFSIETFKRGLDPESLILPVILLLGDIISNPITITYAQFLLGLQEYLRHVFLIIALVLVSIVIIGCFMVRTEKTLRIMGESQAILFLCALLDLGAGILYASHIEFMATIPYVILTVTVFNAIAGSLASIYASRQNVMLHLGLTSHKPSREKLSYLPYMMLLMIYSSILIFGIGIILSYIITGGPGVSAYICLTITLISAIIITPVLWGLIQLFSYLSFRIGFDPDNVMTPILTSVIDFIGAVIYLGISFFIVNSFV